MKKIIIWLAKVFKVDLVRVEVQEVPKFVSIAPAFVGDVTILGDVEITGNLVVEGNLHAKGDISCNGGNIISKSRNYGK